MYVCLCIISMVRSRRDIYKATTFFFVVRTTVVVPGMNLCPSWFRAPRIFVPGCVLSYHPCFTARKDQVSLSEALYTLCTVAPVLLYTGGIAAGDCTV